MLEDQQEKNKSTSSLTYTGKVNIKQSYKGKIIKEISINNNGTNRLFNSICQYLANIDDRLLSNYKPNFIGCSTEEKDLSSSSTSFNHIIDGSMTWISRKEINNSDCILTAVIPGVILNNKIITYLGLFGNDELIKNTETITNNTLLAFIELKGDDIIKDISPQTSLIIEWTINVSNKE